MEKPLVSIVVISYNSAKTIVETLNSIREQTYSPLELIVSDDASADETVAIARAWLNENRSRFVRTNLVVAEKNGGISANLNRGIAETQGEFLKTIAADDILLPSCVECNVRFMRENPNAQIVFSKVREFSIVATGEKKLAAQSAPVCPPPFFEMSAEEQHDILLAGCADVCAPSSFARRKLFTRHPYTPYYTAMEDWPKWLELTAAGIKLFFMDEETVLYRIGGNSVSSTAEKTFYSPRFMDSRKLFYLMELRRELVERNMKKLRARYDREFLRYDLTMTLLGNRKTALNSFLRHIISRFLKIFVR